MYFKLKWNYNTFTAFVSSSNYQKNHLKYEAIYR